MTDKELRKLKKTELLELMLYLRQELDKVKLENEELRAQLDACTARKADTDTKLLETALRMEKQLSALCTAQDIEIHFEEAEDTPDIVRSEGKKTEEEKSGGSKETENTKELS